MTQADWMLLGGGVIIAVTVAALWAVFRLGRSDSSARINPRMLLLRITLGIVFTILGIIGSLLPVLQGWIFFLLAALVIFPESKFAEKVLIKAEPKLPRVVGWLRRIGIGQKAPAAERAHAESVRAESVRE
jgi:hypothetical protein